MDIRYEVRMLCEPTKITPGLELLLRRWMQNWVDETAEALISGVEGPPLPPAPVSIYKIEISRVT